MVPYSYYSYSIVHLKYTSSNYTGKNLGLYIRRMWVVSAIALDKAMCLGVLLALPVWTGLLLSRDYRMDLYEGTMVVCWVNSGDCLGMRMGYIEGLYMGYRRLLDSGSRP